MLDEIPRRFMEAPRSVIPDSHRDLLDRPLLAMLGTIQPDGTPQVMPMWADLADGLVRINTAIGRQKHANMVRNPHVSVLVVDPHDDFRFIEVRGDVVLITAEGANAHADKLIAEYRGPEHIPTDPRSETRVIVSIRPRRVIVNG